MPSDAFISLGLLILPALRVPYGGQMMADGAIEAIYKNYTGIPSKFSAFVHVNVNSKSSKNGPP